MVAPIQNQTLVKSATLTAGLATKIDKTSIGVANGVAGLGSDGKVPSSQLPSFVDDVLEFTNQAAFPATGETGKIYVALDTNKTYRWGGSSYTAIVASAGSTDAVPEGTTNKYFTETRVRGSLLTGLSVTTTTPVLATDNVLQAAGKLQGQFNSLGAVVPTDVGSLNFTTVTGGYSGVGFPGVGGYLRDNGTLVSYYRAGAVNADLFWCDNNGIFVTRGDVGTDSDERLKQNWQHIDTNELIAGLSKVLHGVYDRVDMDLTQLGVGAQSLEQVAGMMHAVRERPDGIKSVSYGQAALVAAVKLAIRSEEQRETIQQQTALMKAMLTAITDLQQRVATLEGR